MRSNWSVLCCLLKKLLSFSSSLISQATFVLTLVAPVAAQTIVVFDPPNSVDTRPRSINEDGWITGSFRDATITTRGFIRTPDGQFTVFEVVPGALSMTVADINASGAVTGVYEPPDDGQGIPSPQRGFIRSPDGQITTFDGFPNSLNDSGQTVGVETLTFPKGFIRSAAGEFTLLEVPNAADTGPEDINNNGDVAGSFLDAVIGIERGFIRTLDGQFTVFDVQFNVPTGIGVDVEHINSSGQVAGWFDDVTMADRQRGFLRSPTSQITVFDPPNSLGLELRGLNDQGEVTGDFVDSSTNSVRGYLRSADGQFTIFDPPNAVMGDDDGTFPRAINNGGQITGWFDDNVTGTKRGFVLTGQEQKLQLTHLGNGGGLQSDVVVFDPSSTASASGEVNFFADDGTPLDSSVFLPDGNSFTLSPLGSATLSTTGAGDLFTGSATISSDTPISAVIRFDITGVGVAGVPASQVLTSAIAPVRRVGTLSSGVAFRNVGSDPIQVTLELKDENGNVVSNGSETRTLAGNAKIAEFIETLFPNAQTTTFTGTICVSVVPDPLTGQSGQIAVIALELDFFNNVFTTLPVSAVN